MTDRVDALMHAVKSPQRKAALDCSAPDPQVEELPVSDNAVLPGRQRRHYEVGWPI
jgi:hypothetical protein